ncbi:hypothetical protein JOF41_000187 [Saccharothrix coeruleofusca]|uniref:hypothetical protein n=1 Tax=Saccharothrix coeruleofusca TaxID=33919 RepID=UPI001FD540C7|nr:hypothetical protein [Saccharothrix coeruleofusca]MBP2334009.1 hypothetical protein [Saccharothrix coeruleofusca]
MVEPAPNRRASHVLLPGLAIRDHRVVPPPALQRVIRRHARGLAARRRAPGVVFRTPA